MILHHGTTRQRAEAIVRDGPDPRFVEPLGSVPSDGFSMADPDQPLWYGSPEQYARGKAKANTSEGEPVILEVDVPPEIAVLANEPPGEYRFDWGYGMEQLLAAWPDLP